MTQKPSTGVGIKRTPRTQALKMGTNPGGFVSDGAEYDKVGGHPAGMGGNTGSYDRDNTELARIRPQEDRPAVPTIPNPLKVKGA